MQFIKYFLLFLLVGAMIKVEASSVTEDLFLGYNSYKTSQRHEVLQLAPVDISLMVATIVDPLRPTDDLHSVVTLHDGSFCNISFGDIHYGYRGPDGQELDLSTLTELQLAHLYNKVSVTMRGLAREHIIPGFLVECNVEKHPVNAGLLHILTQKGLSRDAQKAFCAATVQYAEDKRNAFLTQFYRAGAGMLYEFALRENEAFREEGKQLIRSFCATSIEAQRAALTAFASDFSALTQRVKQRHQELEDAVDAWDEQYPLFNASAWGLSQEDVEAIVLANFTSY